MNNWLEQTRRLLQEATMPRREIALAAGVDYEWLAKFSQGRIFDPGVRKVQALHDFLIRAQQKSQDNEAA